MCYFARLGASCDRQEEMRASASHAGTLPLIQIFTSLEGFANQIVWSVSHLRHWPPSLAAVAHCTDNCKNSPEGYSVEFDTFPALP